MYVPDEKALQAEANEDEDELDEQIWLVVEGRYGLWRRTDL